MHLPNYNEIKTKNKSQRIDYVENDQYSKIGLNKKYFLRTYGCQMNEHDSENIKALLESVGYSEIHEMNNADIIILNTCSIRENAHNKAFGMLGRIKHLKETKKDIIVAICGCMAQEEVVVNKILDKYKWINFVFGTNNLYDLPRLIYQNSKLDVEVYSSLTNIIEGLPIKRTSPYKAYINIIYGCDKFCTYCIVPFTRGHQRSREKEDILDEIKSLSSDYQEVTLLGQNVNAYGKDLYDNYNLANLLEDVAKLGIPRIRFTTSHPWDFTDEMIEVIKKYNNIMPYIHLPLQSGSNNILKLMGRRYTKEEYVALHHKIKENIPNVSITTDIIVGFPNEKEEDFNETLNLVNELKYDLAYTFIYSKRVGTPASKLPDNITKETKEERLYRLNEIVNANALYNNQKYLNKIVEVLVEGFSSKDNMLMGYTDTFKLVNFKGDKKLIGRIIKVKIKEAKSFSLDGEACE